MKVREYEFIVGIETSTQPDAGTPSDPNDIVTKSYADAIVGATIGTEIQEVLAGAINGSNTAFTISQTPINAASFKLYRSGILLVLGTHYTRSGQSITMITAPVSPQTIHANYRY